MVHVNKIIFLLVLLLAALDEAHARRIVAPYAYGRVIIANYSERAGLAPVVFNHWVHRAQYTCRLCHVDIGFAMEKGATKITAAANKQGLYCGVCHNGKRVYNGKMLFASCSDTTPRNDAACERCHSLKKSSDTERAFNDFVEKMPRKFLGNGIDWVEAESRGLIKPIDALEGISAQRPPIKAQKDFSIEANVDWVSDVVFSHKKHAFWNGCEVCHPEIFPIKKGAQRYTMLEIDSGLYCGVCHDKVAFPILDCQRCHTEAK
jgi:c(7)-type cytochrome triheme protein